MTYQKFPVYQGKEVPFIKRKSDNASIPIDTANKDYQEYLEWAKTNTIEAAD
tara:strand:+ start:477 stop:632 length:156 start_codon:yes stop_codon:yes gene_type:complete